MAAVVLNGQRAWKMTRDEEGHRVYKITFVVQCDSLDGPATALQAPGLPVFGTYWIIDNDVDLWAWCRWDAEVEPDKDDEPNEFFFVTFTFSTKPPDSPCKNNEVEDPLQEPPKISGSFVSYSEEATFDRFGNPLLNSAFERLRGPQVEFDGNRPQIKIEMNVPDLDLATLAVSANTVNDAPLWGMPPRCVKLSGIDWEQKYYGQCCTYYTLHLTFDMRYDTFDRDTTDEGTKVLNGQWDTVSGAWVLLPINGKPPDPTNPQHFIKFQGRDGNTAKCLLNGAGLPAGASVAGTSTAPGKTYYMYGANGALSTKGGTGPPAFGWMAFSFNVALPETVWDNAVGVSYKAGQVVTIGAVAVPGLIKSYLCIADVTTSLISPDEDPTHWLAIPPGPTGNSSARSMGIFSPATTYYAGDFVTTTQSTEIGRLHIEKYAESDFTVLGIPLIF